MIVSPADRVPARLVGALREGRSSSEELARVCGGDRAAVMELGRLKSFGYVIEDGRVIESPDIPLPWEIAEGRPRGSVGCAAEYVDVIASTQDEAARLGIDGAVVVASEQTRGRGRSGRAWESPRGGIWMSAYCEAHAERAREPSLIPVAASLAVADAVSAAGAEPRMRWPNDVEIGGKKIAGIAVDASFDGSPRAVIGIGLNFDVDVQLLEARLAGTPGFRGVASLADHAPDATMVGTVRAICDRLEVRLASLTAGSKETVADWTAASSTIGTRVSAGDASGVAARMDQDGSLVIETDDGEVTINAGDVERLA